MINVNIQRDLQTVKQLIRNEGYSIVVIKNSRVIAKRKGYEDRRMRIVESCYTDRVLYPDDNDPSIPMKWKKIREQEREVELRLKEKR